MAVDVCITLAATADNVKEAEMRVQQAAVLAARKSPVKRDMRT